MNMSLLANTGRTGTLISAESLSATLTRSTSQACPWSLYHVEVQGSSSSSGHLPPIFSNTRQARSEKYAPLLARRALDFRPSIEAFTRGTRITRYSEQIPEQPRSRNSAQISDHEYQIRVGKACRVIVETLPDFMSRGVVDLDDLAPPLATHTSQSSRPNFMRRLSFLNQNALKRAIWGKQIEPDARKDVPFDSLYHPSIAFEFRPPIPTIGLGKGSEPLKQTTGPGPDGSSSSDLHRGGPTICFSGRTVYTTSAHVLRHALSALFYDITLHLDSARFEGRSRTASSWSEISSYLRRQSESPDFEGKSSSSGRDRLIIRLRFEGVSRVTLQPHTYTVIFKYDFDQQSGTIDRHVVDNIQPIPGSKVWAGLTNVWDTLSPAGAGRGGAAHYEGLALPDEIMSSR